VPHRRSYDPAVPNGSTDQRYVTNVLVIAAAVLEYLAVHPGATQSELVTALDISVSQAFRTLYTLESLGYVTRTTARGYLLAHKCLVLGNAAARQHTLVPVAGGTLDRLAAETGEGVHLVVRDGLDRVIVAMRESRHPVRVSTPVGSRHALYFGGTGLCILAFSPPAIIDQVLSGVIEARTKRAVTDPRELRAVLARIRENGVHTALGDFADSAFSVAAPVYASDGSVNAAICIAGPEVRFDEETNQRYRGLVVQAGREVSGQLGYQASR
jgi:IclR family KDG regulon transcriptional repressor